MYCCQLLFNSTKSSIKKLTTSYNSVLRCLLCISKPYSASNMFVSSGISTFVELLRKSVYRNLLNSVETSKSKKFVKQELTSITDSLIAFSPVDIFNALKNTKTGKACGVDGLAAEHFIYANKIIHVYLSLLFNCFISHSYLPRDFMKTAIAPIIKNKTGDSSDKNNYRPIALVTACSKIFEICLLEMLEQYLHTHDQQFGFKKQHSTDMCIFTVKSVIKYYTKQKSSVYTCFLNAAKAFDRVSH